MKVALLILVLAIGVAAAEIVSYKDVVVEEWKLFKQQFNKTYDNDSEDAYRLKVFLDNKIKIARHNQRAAAGQSQFTLKLNKYADMKHEEFVKTMNGYKPHLKAGEAHIRSVRLGLHDPEIMAETAKLMREPNAELPKSWDWRQHGLVTSVKDQGKCGSCWAFSATGALEGQEFKKYGNLISLSEQNLVDCSRKYGNMGCNGGLMEKAFEYIRDNRGIDTENSYPYEAHDSKCRFRNKTIGAVDKGYVEIPKNNERKLLQAVATVGPVSVAIDASAESFRFYDAGVYDEPQCQNDDQSLDHGVLVVGYGTDPVGGDYWLVKNSWSETWGSSGYIKMARNKNNQCGIATSACYPIIV